VAVVVSLAEAAPTAPVFHSPLPMAPYQLDGVVEGYARMDQVGGALLAMETGTGKTAVSLMTAALLLEAGEVERVVLVVEASKALDWAEDDVPRFTDLSVGLYQGGRRAELLGAPPQVLVTSYETARADSVTEASGTRRTESFGPLADYMAAGRTLVVYDEAGKMSNRASAVYRINDKMLGRLRRLDGPGRRHLRVLLLTATTMGTSPEGHFNLARLLSRELAGTVEGFQRDHVAGYDQWDSTTPVSFKNLSAADPAREAGVMPLADKLRPLVWRKRKTDPDVAPYFPVMDERRPTFVEPTQLHRDLMTAVYRHFEQEEGEDGPLHTMMRQLVDYPEAILSADGALAREVVRIVGDEGLRRVRSTKADRMLDWARRLGGAQGICFTFYGETVLPLLARDLRDAGVSCSTFAGTASMTARARQRAKHEFTSGGTQVFLTSDAGAQGLNLGCASALLHYEPPTTWRSFVQRSNRLSRFDSPHDRVTVETLVMRATRDVRAYEQMVERSGYDEHLLDDDLMVEGADWNGRVSSAVRRAWLEEAVRG
jgi:helicase-like protein/type III restriction/modification enzyme restriction subunit